MFTRVEYIRVVKKVLYNCNPSLFSEPPSTICSSASPSPATSLRKLESPHHCCWVVVKNVTSMSSGTVSHWLLESGRLCLGDF